ncbi:MAG: phenylalanine--tRNA ligase subunit beta [Candidatus Korarchaeum sp.]
MPVVSFSRSEMERIWRGFSEEEIVELLEFTKLNLESFGDEITFEVTSDRMDLVTLEGIVRCLKGVSNEDLGIPKYGMSRRVFRVEVGRGVEKVRPYVVAALVKGVDLRTEESLVALIEAQEKIHDTLGRKRRRVAIGLHDFSKVKPPIIYDARRAEEVYFVPLGEYAEMSAKEVLEQTEKGKMYAHLVENPEGLVPLIMDSREEVLSMPPIINSELTRLTPGVRDVFIDVTGTDLKAIWYALEVIVSALAERGGEVCTLEISYPDGTEMETPKHRFDDMEVEVDFVRSMIGLNLSNEEIALQLGRARLDVEDLGSKLRVLIPGYRADFLHPVDVVEEVSITLGLNRIGYELPRNVMTVGKVHPTEHISRKVRTLMVGLGYQEVLNYVMTSRSSLFHSVGRDERPVVEVENPVSESYSLLRDSLFPGLLMFLSNNTHVRYPQKVFEIGDVVIVDEEKENRTRDERRVAAAYADDSVGFEDIYSHLRVLSDNLSLSIELEPRSERPFIEGRCASVLRGGEVIGLIGEVDPDVLLRLGLTVPVALFEMRI